MDVNQLLYFMKLFIASNVMLWAGDAFAKKISNQFIAAGFICYTKIKPVVPHTIILR